MYLHSEMKEKITFIFHVEIFYPSEISENLLEFFYFY